MGKPSYFSMEYIRSIDIKWPAAFLILAIYINSGVQKLTPVLYYSKYNDIVVTYQKYADFFPTTYLGYDIDGNTYRIFVGVFELSAALGFVISAELRNTSFYIYIVCACLESYSLLMLEKWHSLIFSVMKLLVCVYLASRTWYKNVKKTNGKRHHISAKHIKKLKIQ